MGKADAAPRILLIVGQALTLLACDAHSNPFAAKDGTVVEYRPEISGTVDHALCLLGFAHVPVRNVKPGHQLVEVEINGARGDFLLDTGANVTVVSAVHAERFGVSPAAGRVLGAGVTRVAGASGVGRQVKVESLTLGDIDIGQRRVVVADLGQLLDALGNVAGREVFGMIGQDVLSRHRAVIDVARPMLYIRQDGSAPAPVPSEKCTARG